MGFAQGFFVRAGERAHEQNLLDIQQKIEKHKAFIGELNRISEDPNYLPEAQQAARNKWLEATQAGPMKFKNYDISDILTVSTKSRAPATGQKFTYPGPPQEEGGPSDYANTFTKSTVGLVPGELGVAGVRSGKYTPEERRSMEAEDYASKMRASYETQLKVAQTRNAGAANKTSGRAIPANEEDLASMGLTQDDGTPYPKGTYYIQHMADGSTRVTPTQEPTTRTERTYNPATGQWELTSVDTRRKEASAIDTTGRRITPGGPVSEELGFTRDPQTGVETWYSRHFDVYGNLLNMVEVPKPAGYLPTESSHTQMLQLGNRLEPYTVVTKRTPGTSTLQPTIPSMPQEGQQPVAPTQVPGQVPGQGVAPQQLAPPTPPPLGSSKVPIRNSAEFLAPKDTFYEKRAKVDKVNALISPNYIPEKVILDPMTNVIRRSRPSDEEIGGVRRTTTGGFYKNQPALTPQQMEKTQNSSNVMGTTSSMLSDLLAPESIAAINSLSNRLRIKMATSSSSAAQLISSTLSGLDPFISDTERKVVDLFSGIKNNLKEHIQVMRTPLGAAGFRSLEAFFSLQAQAGDMLSRPEITKIVMENSLKTVLTIQAAYRYSLYYSYKTQGYSNVNNIPDAETKTQYLLAYGTNPEAALAAMRRDGYTVPGGR